jgi:hypothetical protein
MQKPAVAETLTILQSRRVALLSGDNNRRQSNHGSEVLEESAGVRLPSIDIALLPFGQRAAHLCAAGIFLRLWGLRVLDPFKRNTVSASSPQHRANLQTMSSTRFGG